MTETQERFLRAVAERLPLDRVAEVHLFPSIRQAGVETGVAVIAVQAEAAGAAIEESAEAGVPDGAVAREDEFAPGVPREVASDAADDVPPLASGDGVAPRATDDARDAAAADDATAAEDAIDRDDGDDGDDADDAGAPPQLQHAAVGAVRPHHFAAAGGERPPAPRHTIFSARYRLTLKGPDRGRWEADVVAEADAPLATADLVVRGVRKRTGEAAEAERVAPEVLRQLLAQPA